MKTILTSIAASSLLAALALAQPPRYTLTDLGTLPGGTLSQANFANNNGLITGLATLPHSTIQHAVLWQGGRIIDIAKPELGGLNSGAFGVNEFGQVSGQIEASTKDPNGENVCGYVTSAGAPTGLKCLPFRWQNGVMTQLPLLGGNNGTVGTINNLGQVAGVAETGLRDASCASTALRYEAVIWGPNPGDIHALPPFGSDTVGVALAINDHGQAVGASGLCSNSSLPPLAFGTHAVLWESDGSVHDLGNLGAAAGNGSGNIGLAINNLGQVVGASATTADSTPAVGVYAFLWTREKGIRNLGTLPGDTASGGVGINDGGEVVGLSVGSGGIRAVLWQNGRIADLNNLIPAHSPLFLLFASAINSSGEIVGFGVHKATGELHAFRATPNNGAAARESFSPESPEVTSPMVLSEDARMLIQQRLGFGGFGALTQPR